jgi:hypothetical protein
MQYPCDIFKLCARAVVSFCVGSGREGSDPPVGLFCQPKPGRAALNVPRRLQRKYSVAKIDSADTYEKGLPKQGGLSDLRMGTTEKRGAVCTTDGADLKDCPGYFGHIELARPMWHCGFIKTVVKVLRCVSYHTSNRQGKEQTRQLRCNLCGSCMAQTCSSL